MKVNRQAIPAEVERAVLIEAGHRCAVCGIPTPLERAHIVPWRDRKEHTAANLICLCANCHERSHKESWGQKTLREYKQHPWVYRQYGAGIEPNHPDAVRGAAEAQVTTLPRPWVAIVRYYAELIEDEETGQEDLWERLHLVNLGQAPAVSIVIPQIHLAGRTARLLSQPPPLGPGEDIHVEIRNLRRTLERVLHKVPVPSKGGPKSLRLPLVVEYRGLDHSRWSTEHTISYSVYGIEFTIAHPNDPQQWTDLSILEQEPASA
jgi:HNH endonuclease